LRVAQIAKEQGAERVVAGGPHVTIKPQDLIREGSPVDYAVRGEAEEQLEVFEGNPSERIIQAKRVEKLDSLPWAARESLVGIEKYNPSDLGFIMTSRGCPGSCNFCCSEELWGKKVRSRNISDVIEEMDHIHNSWGTTKFYLTDDTFTMNRRRVFEFTQGIMNRGYNWGCLTRVDRLDESMLEQMANSGCNMVKLGIESGSQKVLNLMNKKTSLKQARNAASILNDAAMPWMAYLMVGVPGENSEDVNLTMQFIEDIKPTYISAAIYTPYVGTGFYNSSIKSNECIGLKDHEGKDHAIEEANHHSLRVLAGNVPREKIIEFMKFADNYNEKSKNRLDSNKKSR
jgi:radical SAM superfamily enzyme YgiQ (UPF0313 family)